MHKSRGFNVANFRCDIHLVSINRGGVISVLNGSNDPSVSWSVDMMVLDSFCSAELGVVL